MICRYLVTSTAFSDCIALRFRSESFSVRSYCGREQRQEPLRFPAVTAPVSLHIFIVPQKWVSRSQSPPTLLPYVPSCPQWSLARKTVLPTEKLKGASQKGKKN